MSASFLSSKSLHYSPSYRYFCGFIFFANESSKMLRNQSYTSNKAVEGLGKIYVKEATQFCVHGGLQQIKGSLTEKNVEHFTILRIILAQGPC